MTVDNPRVPAWKKKLFNRVNSNRKLRVKYLRMARFMATRGMTPPLTVPAEQHEKKWQDQGKEESTIQPEVYTQYNDSVAKLFMDVLPLLKPESNILEIGCNAGRSLNYLYEKGFRNFTGLEIGTRALEIFKETFPEVYNCGTIIECNAAEGIKKLESNAYDLVFTHSVLTSIGAKHNHIFAEMCRVSRGFILILESEGQWQSFPRDYERLFNKHGYKMVAYRWMVWEGDKLTFPMPINDQHVLKNNTIRLFSPIEKL